MGYQRSPEHARACGYHIILTVECELDPRYVALVQEFRKDDPDDPRAASVKFPELLRCWQDLDIAGHMHTFSVSEGSPPVWSMRIEKKPCDHNGPLELEATYARFIYKILQTVATDVRKCVISHNQGFASREFCMEDGEMSEWLRMRQSVEEKYTLDSCVPKAFAVRGRLSRLRDAVKLIASRIGDAQLSALLDSPDWR